MSVDANAIIGPLVLFVLMGLVGLELSPADFRRVALAPRAVVAGTLAQLALLPLMTWGVVVLLDVPPVLGAGAVLVAVSPGAGASNVLAAVARADIALSVTLTAVTSVLSVVTLPVVTAISLQVILESSAAIDVPVWPLIEQLSVALLLPIGLGMTVRARFPDFVFRHRRSLHRAGGAIIGLLLAGLVFFVAADDQRLPLEDAGRAFAAAVVWTAAAMAIGWGVASLARLSGQHRATFLIEFSARNVGVSAIIALSSLERLDLTLFSAVYGAIGFPMVFVAALVLRRRSLRESPEPPSVP